ncbi:uncharacterized protein F4822DRAFT_406845 [Hypoxylon trugodes]|uniref:uncharacterized protein n=1 Tax=Hypoxylon trugodes TaxID=326681 RepID=UPI002194CD80|nr:uncharacterized protein F4822DRAFT_406845 [Hypoxylon trugodes]KAI1387538.1 hypothetical protein F4822DRAFT_406845 [Hypoxylon trugodes]
MADDAADLASRPKAAIWFSSDVGEAAQGPWGWRLDVVTLLAVIGESSVAEHTQTITASIFCLLPRIIPAPQAFLKPSRPIRLPETTAKMTGVHSGVTLDTVGFFASIIHPLEELQPYSVKVLRITHADDNDGEVAGFPSRPTNGSTFFWPRSSRKPTSNVTFELPTISRNSRSGGARSRRTAASTAYSTGVDEEAGGPHPGIKKRATFKEKVRDLTSRPAIPATFYSPVHILSVFSTLLTFGIIAFAAYWQDGTAIIAVALVSLASSVVGWASWWRPLLMKRDQKNVVPDGDVIIRTREGAFLLVKCTEDVARELYSGTEECNYRVSGRSYRVLMALGTCLLMVSVILLGNCKWYTQIFIGGSYIVLNGLYWAMGLLPKKYFWDLSRYNIEDITPEDAQHAHQNTGSDKREDKASFTRTLWYAIRETKLTAWVHRSGAAPDTQKWRKWLAEAKKAAEDGDENWKPVARKDEIMEMREDEPNRSPVTSEPPGTFDTAEQAAPLSQVQPPNQRPSNGAL